MSTAKSTLKKIMSPVRRFPRATRPSTLLACAWAVAPTTSASTPVASLPQASSIPTAMKLESRLEPPWLTKGSVRPVRGMRRVTPPTMMKACRTIEAVRPAAISELTSLFARAATTMPRTAKHM